MKMIRKIDTLIVLLMLVFGLIFICDIYTKIDTGRVIEKQHLEETVKPTIKTEIVDGEEKQVMIYESFDEEFTILVKDYYTGEIYR